MRWYRRLVTRTQKNHRTAEDISVIHEEIFETQFGSYGKGSATGGILQGKYQITEKLYAYTEGFLKVCTRIKKMKSKHITDHLKN